MLFSCGFRHAKGHSGAGCHWLCLVVPAAGPATLRISSSALATSQRIARHRISWYIKPYSSREFPSEGNSASPGDIWQDLGTFFAATI